MDSTKHISVFDPNKFDGTIAVVGLGSIGSNVALHLAKLGLGSKMLLLDFDKVEPHNLSNQILYGHENIGMYKSEAAAFRIAELTDGVEAMPVYEIREVINRSDIEDATAVFLCVDSMAVRKQIFNSSIMMNPHISYFADGRMGARFGMTYGFNPKNLPKAKAYRDRLYPDEDVPLETGGCGITLSIGATATFVACQMIWQFINHTAFNLNGGTAPFEELCFKVDDLEVHSKGFL